MPPAFDLSPGKHTPHLLGGAFSWHLNYLRSGRYAAGLNGLSET
jgi:hypothetical protein